jgi:hypothetical protein
MPREWRTLPPVELADIPGSLPSPELPMAAPEVSP